MKRSFISSIGRGFAGGCLGGGISGAIEGWWIASHSAEAGYNFVAILSYAIALYAVVGCTFGATVGLVIEMTLRLCQKSTSGEKIYGLSCGLTIGAFNFVIWRFLIKRDIFQEHLNWVSPEGIFIQMAMIGACLLTLYLFFKIMGSGLERISFKFIHGPWFNIALVAIICTTGAIWSKVSQNDSATHPIKSTGVKGKKPNIILIMVDTLRADYTDPYGAKGLTPNLKSFAEEGVVFRRAYAQASWTRPSVATVLTGRYPSSHRAIYKMDSLPDKVETIAEVLKKAGYATSAIVTNYVTSPYFGFAQGFDQYHYLEPKYFLWAGDATSKTVLYEGIKKLWSRFIVKGSRAGYHYRDGKTLTDVTIRWMEKWNAKKTTGSDDRFFLFIQYMDPHDPYFAHPDDGKAIARKATPNPPSSWLERMKKLYAGEVKFFDEQFGRLLTFLRKQNWWKEALVVFFSDHGEEFMEHGGWWHGDTLYEEQIRVPLIVKLPGGEGAGRQIDTLVGLVDVAPTICRYGRAKNCPEFQGIDLFEEREPFVYVEEDHVGNILKAMVYRKKTGELMKIIKANRTNPRGLPERSLFNLTNDPNEKANLFETQKEEFSLAFEKLAELTKKAMRGAVKRKSVFLDRTSKEHLKNLGYIRE